MTNYQNKIGKTDVLVVLAILCHKRNFLGIALEMLYNRYVSLNIRISCFNGSIFELEQILRTIDIISQKNSIVRHQPALSGFVKQNLKKKLKKLSY